MNLFLENNCQKEIVNLNDAGHRFAQKHVQNNL